MAGPKVDPALAAELEKMSAGEETLDVVVQLLPEELDSPALSPERTEEVTRQLLTRIAGKIGVSATDVNVFKHLGSFVVSAPKAFIRELVDQPEIAAAVSNRR